MKLCNLVFKLQPADDRHTHMESPWSAKTRDQKEIKDLMHGTIRIDQCMVGLKNPQNQQPIEKKTRIQTTSKSLLNELDSRICHHHHEHCQIAGTCQCRGHTIPMSKFAGMYPTLLAKSIIKGILKEKGKPYELPIYHVSELEEPAAKRAKHDHVDCNEKGDNHEMDDHEDNPSNSMEPWQEIMNKFIQELSKSGVQTWTNPMNPIFREVQKLMPQYRIGAIRAGQGLNNRYIVGDQGWVDNLPLRHTILMQRFTHQLCDLGAEDCSRLSKQKLHRHAKPSHVMVCIFAEKNLRDPNAVEPDTEMPAIVPASSNVRDMESPGTSNPVATWTPLSASVSGPKFLELSKEDRGKIEKLHTNLGHPTSEKLARHLSEANAPRNLIDGARDYPRLSLQLMCRTSEISPGTLKDPKEFNERVSIDGFDWKGKRGITSM